MRIRSVKPEFWQSEKVASVSRDARLLFIGLWGLADDHGRFRASPRWITGQLFPYDADADVAGWLTLLERLGLVQLYEDGGQHFGWVRGFEEHQKIDRRWDSRLPAPPVPPQSSPKFGGARRTSEGLANLSANLADSTPLERNGAGNGTEYHHPPKWAPDPDGVGGGGEPDAEPTQIETALGDLLREAGYRKSLVAAEARRLAQDRMTAEDLRRVIEGVKGAATRSRGGLLAHRLKDWREAVRPNLARHVPNMPRGTACCQCEDCVAFRGKKKARPLDEARRAR